VKKKSHLRGRICLFYQGRKKHKLIIMDPYGVIPADGGFDLFKKLLIDFFVGLPFLGIIFRLR